MSLILSGTDGLSDVDGSAATPAIRGTDANTGIFFPAADTIAFSEGGAEIARFDSSGNLGVGTASPAAKLQVVGSFRQTGATVPFEWTVNSGANDFYKLNGVGYADNLIVANSAGNVGIGTASPNAKLQVSSSTDFGAVLKVSDTSSESTGFVVLGNGNSTDKAVGIWRGAANSVSSSGTFLNLGGYGGMAFSTGAALLGSQTERMRIDSSGNLLVGTTSVVSVGAGAHILSLRASSTSWGVGPTSTFASFYVKSATSTGVALGTSATAWSSDSDERKKTTITPFENAINKICSLRAGTGRYLTDEESMSRSFLIAQDVQSVLPEAVDVGEDVDQSLMLRYTDVIPLLVAAIKEQNQLIQSLTDRITALETPAVTPPTGTQV